MRLGIDPGSVRIGVARCDPDGLLATPLDTVPRGPGDLDRLVRLALEHDAVEVIVGLPTGLSGREGAAAAAARSFADALAARLVPIPVRLVDERFTTVLAHDALRQGGKGGRARRQAVDRAAAAVLLQGALDAERAAGRPPGEIVGIQPQDGRVSRHGRRGTQGDDEQWGPGDYPPPDADEPFAPGDYGQARRDWPRNPIATADTGDFPPVADPSLPPGSYPRDPGGRRNEDFDWGPDPLGLDTRGSRGRGAGPPDSDPQGFDPQGFDPQGFDPRGSGARGGERPGGQSRPEPMAPDRWTPQSWEPPSWERASWDSQPAGPAGWLNPPGAGPDWAEHGDPRGAPPGGFDDLQAGELPPLPPGPMPDSGHPSGPLPPLPESDHRWGEPPPGPLPPAGPRSRPGRGEDEPRRRSRHGAASEGGGPAPGGYPGDPDGYPRNGTGFPDHRAGYPEDEAGYPDNPGGYLPDWEEPADYQAPRGGRRAAARPSQMSDRAILGMRATWTTHVTWTWPRIRGRIPGTTLPPGTGIRAATSRIPGPRRTPATPCCPGWTRATDPGAAVAAAPPVRRASAAGAAAPCCLSC